MKKKSKLIGGILLMILGLGVTAGSTALRIFDHHGMGPFHHGSGIINRYSPNQNYNFQNPRKGRLGGNFNNNQPSTPNNQNQNSNSN